VTEDQAEDIWITAMVKAHFGQATTSKRLFKAKRVLNMRDAIKLYESLSEEFVRKGIASNRFSELEQLFKIAEVSLTDYEDKEKELAQANKQVDIYKEIIKRFCDNVNYYERELAGSWMEIRTDAEQALAKSESIKAE
jgi:hypothetical protein